MCTYFGLGLAVYLVRECIHVLGPMVIEAWERVAIRRVDGRARVRQSVADRMTRLDGGGPLGIWCRLTFDPVRAIEADGPDAHPVGVPFGDGMGHGT